MYCGVTQQSDINWNILGSKSNYHQNNLPNDGDFLEARPAIGCSKILHLQTFHSSLKKPFCIQYTLLVCTSFNFFKKEKQPPIGTHFIVFRLQIYSCYVHAIFISSTSQLATIANSQKRKHSIYPT